MISSVQVCILNFLNHVKLFIFKQKPITQNKEAKKMVENLLFIVEMI